MYWDTEINLKNSKDKIKTKKYGEVIWVVVPGRGRPSAEQECSKLLKKTLKLVISQSNSLAVEPRPSPNYNSLNKAEAYFSQCNILEVSCPCWQGSSGFSTQDFHL